METVAQIAETKGMIMGLIVWLRHRLSKTRRDATSGHPPLETGVASCRVRIPDGVQRDVFRRYPMIPICTWFTGVMSIHESMDGTALVFMVSDQHGVTDAILQYRLDWLMGLTSPPEHREEWSPLPVQAAEYARGHSESIGGWRAVIR